MDWSGTDPGGSGIASYDVQVRDGAGAWTDWQVATVANYASFTGVNGHTYAFRSRARDNAGNLEAYPATPDASTTVDTVDPQTAVGPLPVYSPATFTVTWGGSDPGGSGIVTYDVQVRDGPTGAWIDWLREVTGTTLDFNGVTGHTYYFRSSGADYAGNGEVFPAQPDAFTSVDTQPPYTLVQDLPPFTRGSAAVNWSGVDPGGSGIATYDIQTRDGAGAWADWQLATAATGAAFNGTPGHTVYFQSRARDGVGNQEAYPAGDGDAHTTFYAWMAEGMVMDNSGTPVAGAVITGTPGVFFAPPSDEWGAYAFYAAVTPVDPRQVQVSKAGYGALPAARILDDDDVTFDAILPPGDNLIPDPGFESGAFTWGMGGALPPVIGTQGHTGFYAASLGAGGMIPGTPGTPSSPSSPKPSPCPPR